MIGDDKSNLPRSNRRSSNMTEADEILVRSGAAAATDVPLAGSLLVAAQRARVQRDSRTRVATRRD